MMLSNARTDSSRGFTLVEMMVVVLIFGIVSVGLMQVLTGTRDSYEQQKVTLEMQQNARSGIAGLADDFRHVSYGKDATQPSIYYAANDSVVFVADLVPSIDGAEVISYSLSFAGDPDTPNPTDTILLKTVTDTSGTVLFSDAQAYGIKAGGLTLRYFNGAGVEMVGNPVPSPELIGEVLIEVTAVEPRAHHRTGEYMEEKLSTTVYPRNLPLTPARSRPSIPTITGLSIPNCESVTVNWQTPTTYTDGQPLEMGDISHFSVLFGTHPDSMSLFCRVARTFNQWTVPDLDGGTNYYFGTTCTARNGVESYMSIDNTSLSTALFPDTPTGFSWVYNPSGGGIRLEWNVVTTFTTGATITTPVDYSVYRSTSTGFTPTPVELLGTVAVQNWFTDSSQVDCTPYFYLVTASACANESSPSSELALTLPPSPGCVSNIALALTATSGEIEVTWSRPTIRNDGSPLASGDVGGARIFFDETPFSVAQFTDYFGTDTTLVIGGLTTCSTYFVHIAAYDQCPNLGAVCTSFEVAIDTSVPCDPGAPVGAPTLVARGLDGRIDLSWPANDTDCDLEEYRVYYGFTPGGPYNGTGALEGTSPVPFVPAAIVGGDDSCRVSLTGLATCQNYYCVVTAVDGCAPENESTPSPEAQAQTECMACEVDAGCVGYMSSGPGENDVRLELYSVGGADEQLTELTPTWTGGGAIREVHAGRPLNMIWECNGLAGGDGAIGPQASGMKLDVDDLIVTGSSVLHDGIPLMLVYDAIMNGSDLTLDYRVTAGGLCSSGARQVGAGLLFDDYDDGDISDWTLYGGTWFVDNGVMVQSNISGTTIATLPGSFTDFVYEAKFNVDSGSYGYLLYRGDVGSNDYSLIGIKIGSALIRLCRVTDGSFYTIDQATWPVSNDTWYTLKVEVSGNTVTGYIDCQEVLQATDPAMLPSGEIGYRTYGSCVLFDDLRVYSPLGL